ncbi:hypothetical protein [Streptomyces lunaelactis]|uniref:hypothetical protein n=1 Tax=Streptomyces lunaelactis TaxID=1535768 RepID=UPI0015846233|nr:hypothetical protein [Streptomyces lunaelactis]NUL14495.1 hypothetical protein [Streptomyces lunaelactis]
MPRRILTGCSLAPATGKTTPSYRVENDPSRAIFDSPGDAEEWRDRLDDPDDLGRTATQACG